MPVWGLRKAEKADGLRRRTTFGKATGPVSPWETVQTETVAVAGDCQ
jgi:hypothetical protein